jgi:uncharacterized RDD family membrane protein YckC
MIVAKKYQTFWRRFWAACVDFVVLSPLPLVGDWLWNQQAPLAVHASWFVLWSLLWPAYSIYLHGRFGQTLGKHLLRIKVIDVSGDDLTMTRCCSSCGTRSRR